MIQDLEIDKRFASLSTKQRAVLDLLAQNLTSKEIARELNVSPYAVEQRIHTFRTKFGPVPRRELVRIYAELAGAFQSPMPYASRFTAAETSERSLERTEEPIPIITESKLKFLVGFFSGLSLGLLVAMTSILATYQIVSGS